jgi:hypothetical protein
VARIVACIEDAQVIEKILQHLGFGGASDAEHLAHARPEGAACSTKNLAYVPKPERRT